MQSKRTPPAAARTPEQERLSALVMKMARWVMAMMAWSWVIAIPYQAVRRTGALWARDALLCGATLAGLCAVWVFVVAMALSLSLAAAREGT